jgi:uncharacterized membrane protein YkvI
MKIINRNNIGRFAGLIIITVFSFIFLTGFLHTTNPQVPLMEVMKLSAKVVGLILMLAVIFVWAARKSGIAPFDKPSNSGGNNP